MELPIDDITLRLGGAAVSGALIGFNRDLHGKPIGTRTLGLVALGAAVVAVASIQYSDLGSHPDAISRVVQGIIQGVMAGISFIGAGVILRDAKNRSVEGQAQFGQLGPDPILLAAAEKPVPLKSIYTIVRKVIFTGVVKPDSPITSFAEMKGKVIGLPSLSSALIPYVTSRLTDVGLSASDVKIIDTGYGVASMDALKNGTIDMFVAWPGLFAAYENAGYKFRVLPEAPWQNDYYGGGLATTNDYLAKNPDVVAKIGRGLAKSTVLMKSNLDALIEPFWKAYPTQAPLPTDDRAKAVARERVVLKATAAQMLVDKLPATFQWGSQDQATWERHLKRLKETKQLPETAQINVSDYFTNAFAAQYNEFDRDAVAKPK